MLRTITLRSRLAALMTLLFVVHATSAATTITTGNEPLRDRQERPWEPEAPNVQIPLWPDGLAIAAPASPGAESFGTPVKAPPGQKITFVEHVSRPTMTIYAPKGKNTGVAMMVFPGGGYRVLAIDLEGTDICDWLTGRGITCVVLKYRVPGSGPYYADECNCARIPPVPMALQDAQRAMGMLRERAASLGIDPHKIGVVGFSAGGRLVADISNHTTRAYKPIDDADKQSSRPDFAIAGYPGHLWKGPNITLRPDVKISPDAPPTFIVQAGDDPVDDVRESITYYVALQQAGIPVEMHLYAVGGHGFGIRKSPNPISDWTVLAERWMRTIGVMPSTGS
jgi:acetyl esterase/lipase